MEDNQYKEINNDKIALNGKEWLKYSISVWDIVKTSKERELNHPAIFPIELCERLIKIFSKPEEKILDVFAGSGSTLIAAKNLNRDALGFETNTDYIKIFKKRISQTKLLDFAEEIKEDKVELNYKIYNEDANNIRNILDENSIDLTITSPPYWDILNQKRTAYYKENRNYSDSAIDLGNIEDYQSFLKRLKSIFEKVYVVTKMKKYCIIIVMDIRKKDEFFAFHMDVVNFMKEIGWYFDDLIIWNRSKEYNNLKPLGYPYIFRINKVHEYILIFQKK